MLIFSACGNNLRPLSEEEMADLGNLVENIDFETVDLWGYRVDFGEDAYMENGGIWSKSDPEKKFGVAIYDDPGADSEGLGDFMISSELHRELMSGDKPCELLESGKYSYIEDFYLPIYLEGGFLCGAEQRDGMTIISLLGGATRFEGLPWIDGMFMILTEDEMISVVNMIQGDLRVAIDEKYNSNFEDEISNVDFGSAEWSELNNRMESKLAELVEEKDLSLVEALEYVKAIASSTERVEVN